MEQHNHPEELEPKAAEAEAHVEAQPTEDGPRNRRSFLKNAAVGVAGAASLMALGAQSAQAESTRAAAKNKILERIRANMAAQDILPMEDGGGDAGVYVKNSHALYLK